MKKKYNNTCFKIKVLKKLRVCWVENHIINVLTKHLFLPLPCSFCLATYYSIQKGLSKGLTTTSSTTPPLQLTVTTGIINWLNSKLHYQLRIGFSFKITSNYLKLIMLIFIDIKFINFTLHLNMQRFKL